MLQNTYQERIGAQRFMAELDLFVEPSVKLTDRKFLNVKSMTMKRKNFVVSKTLFVLITMNYSYLWNVHLVESITMLAACTIQLWQCNEKNVSHLVTASLIQLSIF